MRALVQPVQGCGGVSHWKRDLDELHAGGAHSANTVDYSDCRHPLPTHSPIPQPIPKRVKRVR
jgi:hypothetical protein